MKKKDCNTSLDRTPVSSSGCKQFYLCALNRLNIVSCPTGLLFDKTTRKCNYANQVICDELITSTTTILATTTKGIIIKFKFYFKN